MPGLTVVLDAVGVALLLVLLYGISLVVRRRFLSRNGGTFELSYRARSTKAGHGWLLGMGRYAGEDLEWFRIFSLSLRPKRTWDRATLEYTGHRDPEGVEGLSLVLRPRRRDLRDPHRHRRAGDEPGLAGRLPVVAPGDAPRHAWRPAG